MHLLQEKSANRGKIMRNHAAVEALKPRQEVFIRKISFNKFQAGILVMSMSIVLLITIIIDFENS